MEIFIGWNVGTSLYISCLVMFNFVDFKLSLFLFLLSVCYLVLGWFLENTHLHVRYMLRHNSSMF